MASCMSALLIVIALLTYLTGIMSEDKKSIVYDFSKPEFAENLYKVLRSTPGNLFFSPYSLQVALAMAYSGAKGDTATEFRKSLMFPEKLDSLFEAVKASTTSLQEKANVTLNIANAMFMQQNYTILDSFKKHIVDIFKAEAQNVDFSDVTQSCKSINDFVNKSTNGKITQLLDENSISSLTRLVLVNAIYFKGSWKHQFNASRTFKGDFHLGSNETVQVDYMTTKEKFKFGENEELKSSVVVLPYEGNISMVLVVPNEVEGIKHLEEKIGSGFGLDKITENTFMEEVNLTMPKFKLEQKMELSKTLKEMGLSSMFDPVTADFRGITKEKELYVSEAIQKAFIEVNEEGSEAAAATGLGFSMRMMPRPPHELHVKSPFLFFLKDSDGTIIFIGRCAKP